MRTHKCSYVFEGNKFRWHVDGKFSERRVVAQDVVDRHVHKLKSLPRPCPALQVKYTDKLNYTHTPTPTFAHEASTK